MADRALALLAAFDPAHRRLSLTGLAQRSGLPLSTARRLADRLCGWGALERVEGGYVVGLRLWEVASLAPRGLGLLELARPVMEDLYEATRHHVLLAVLDGEDALLVERRSATGAVEVEYRIGGRLPLHRTGVGLVLLAHAAGDLQEEVLRQVAATEVGDQARQLRATLSEVRRTGVAVLRRDQPAPVLSVGAPVRGPGDAVQAALSIVVPAGAWSHRALEPAVRAAARAVSRGLGAPSAAAGSG
ncbi:IclR family transcriptional regulator [Klenkia sp. PcliD-1-E]|uniref:IclR family transcriptional regulator n=1 Tax=Klenkia sp. PcliD-1-E TaxID=2954492 RepID=UPI00209718BC|nr:IclR family transcriptional regulator C-terminal domain-containing protein [Klenkia sp. PcliD-1-E]MCO7220911.1 helix-turn-helix domain-containing protein [Klenkia sp. PcliD-1-E]